MKIIWAFVLASFLMPQFLYSDEESNVTAAPKTSSFKTPVLITRTTPAPIKTKTSEPIKKIAASKQKKAPNNKPAQKQITEQQTPAKPSSEKLKEEKKPQTPAKKIKPAAPAVAALIKNTKTTHFVAPFENMKKQPASSHAPTKSSAEQARNPILPPQATLQNLAEITIGNASSKPMALTSVTFSYKHIVPEEKSGHPIENTKTHKISFSKPRIIAPLKKTSFTISMKGSYPLQFAGIKNIHAHLHNIPFEPAITDTSNPIVLAYDKNDVIRHYTSTKK